MRGFFFLMCILLISAFTKAQGVYAYYPLAGNAKDASGDGWNGSIIGSPATVSNQNGSPDSALQFNGSNEYVDLLRRFDFNTKTIVAWFNLNAVDSINTIYACDNEALIYGQVYFETIDSAGVPLLCIIDEQYRWTSEIQTGTWYQVGLVRTPAEVRFFVNKMLVFQASSPNGQHTPNQSTFNSMIGCDRNYVNLFNGTIDDVSFYDIQIPDSEIGNIYLAISEVHQVDESLKAYTQTGDVYVQLPDNLKSDIEAVKLYAINGEQLSIRNSMQLNERLNNTQLPAGTYLVSVSFKNTQKTVARKVIVTG
jgi:hypothetical protein